MLDETCDFDDTQEVENVLANGNVELIRLLGAIYFSIQMWG